MIRLLRLLVDLALLRIGPQDLPYSIPRTRALVVVAVAIDLLYAVFIGLGELLLPRMLLSVAMLLGAPWLLLRWRARLPRYAQTLGALAGTGVLFKLAMLPLALTIADMPLPAQPEQLQPAQVLVGWLTLALLSWRLLVNAHIFRHALDIRLGMALLVALGLVVVELALAQLLLVSGA